MTTFSALEQPLADQRAWAAAVRVTVILFVVAAIAVVSFAVGRVTVHTSASPAKATPTQVAPATDPGLYLCRVGRPC
jgi:hypothetical protein